MNNLKNWFKNFKLKERWGKLVVFISPILFSVMFGFNPIKEYLGIFWFIVIIILLAIITFWGWLSNIISSDSISNLKNKKLQLRDQKEHIESVLHSLPEEFSILLSNKWDLQGDSRITIYRYTSTHFIPVSRYSKNPDYHNINRKSYPKNVGYISKCWVEEKGKYFNNLPDPMVNERKYIDCTHSETKMLKKDIKELTMKSRAYYGKTLYDKNGQAFLIIMVESTNPEIKNIEEIKQDLESTLSEFVISIVKANIPPEGGSANE